MAGFEVTSRDLSAHAGKVDAHAESLGTAVDAANQVMPDGAYGVICQFLPPLFNDVEAAAHEALTAARDGLRTVADNLRDTADDYDSEDLNAMRSFTGIEGGLR
ncbi:excreted virulence factor EspC (type VII ESX diderm) [Saccharothrix carnea]|uniref:Excreted virulence factor EspC (Type VII ESX diderm) n=1 Tax=Saccharothrix carnea TaxID=1280637 RepID=A0A2P8IFB5_SACCR|nr:type VII secretion target [Saccharothrix carnea]PSL57147.1 excreted virulence factor EspC (type VII ESX diderm) [Saccharothrix carnea]